MKFIKRIGDWIVNHYLESELFFCGYWLSAYLNGGCNKVYLLLTILTAGNIFFEIKNRKKNNNA